MTTIYCADDSLSHGEAQFGTGPGSGVFILIEWNQSWGAKADEDFANTVFAPEPRHRWERILAALPNPKVQVIKRSRNGNGSGFQVYVAVPTEEKPRLYAFRLQDYAELLTLDYGAMVNDDPRYQAQLSTQFLILVCTNGKRDVCCARDGMALYNALNMLEGAKDAVWQANHLGGHRFSATMLSLPSGIFYGRVAPSMAKEVLQSCHEGTVINALYRGRACYSKPEQAAEYLLREKTGIHQIDGFRLLSAENEANFVFEATADGSQHHLTLETVPSEWQVLFSTGDAEGKTVPIYSLAHHAQTAPTRG